MVYYLQLTRIKVQIKFINFGSIIFRSQEDLSGHGQLLNYVNGQVGASYEDQYLQAHNIDA
jgi:hypothetical protein